MCAAAGFLLRKGTLLDHSTLLQDSLDPCPIGQLDTHSNRTQDVAETKGLGARPPPFLQVCDWAIGLNYIQLALSTLRLQYG